MGIDGVELNDVRTGVTEACNNVVLHAYRGRDGPMEVAFGTRGDEGLDVAVRDHGVGIRTNEDGLPAALREQETAAHPLQNTAAELNFGRVGVGLQVIRALARDVELTSLPAAVGGGSEVRMSFAAPHLHPLATDLPDRLRSLSPRFAPGRQPDAGKPNVRPADGGAGEVPGAGVRPRSTIEVELAPTRLARTVLPRLMYVLAARAHFTVDRLSDLQLLADVLVGRIEGMANGPALLGISLDLLSAHELQLCLGPLVLGGAEQLVRESHIDGLGSVIGKLAGSHEVIDTFEHAEELVLRLSDPPSR